MKEYAEKNGIECDDWLTLKSNGAKIKYDLGVVVSFGHLIPENIINMFPQCVNQFEHFTEIICNKWISCVL